MGVVKHGAELVDHLIRYHQPELASTVETMTELRQDFLTLGHKIVARTPAGPDQAVAIRKLHEACQATIGNLALNEGADHG
jgi:hypothetical protein